MTSWMFSMLIGCFAICRIVMALRNNCLTALFQYSSLLPPELRLSLPILTISK